MYHSLLPLVGWVATLLVCVLAWWKGGRAEQYGAALKLATSLIALAVHGLLNQSAISGALLTADGLLAVGFLGLAIRYVSLWLGAAMILQAGQFSLHAWYLVNGLERDRFFAVANNLITAGILACILTGTLVVWRRQARAAQAA
ncbi:MAG: hypothetical protein ACOY4K_05115 [Pseudomonadota bacterium]